MDRKTAQPVLGGSIPAGTAPAEAESPEFLSRDLSWLEFNRRVLHEALDSRTPLLERVRFLGIFTSNLDEFYMKRVGGLRQQIASGLVSHGPDATSPSDALAQIRRAVLPMLKQQSEAYLNDIRPALAANGTELLEWNALTSAEREQASSYFEANVFPVLTPLAVDPGIPFPFISNLSNSLGVVLHHPDSHENLFARVKVPEVLPKWLRVGDTAPGASMRFVSLQEIIRHNLQDLFPDMAVADVMVFRITRNADLERDEEDAEDLLELMEAEIRQRKFAKVVRLEVSADANPWMLDFLTRELELTREDVYEMPAEVDFDDLRQIAELNVPKLRYEPWMPVVPPPLGDEDADMFSVIHSGDVLVHLPYESYTASVERFIRTAAADPKVLAIKMTVYRT
ncbi:MAG TPA: hypothetical protein VN541_07015, partial [Tepidisphaeraceae bacterium]|nr:hypothetical protein [Tepidisphaeraceae bacterium]